MRFSLGRVSAAAVIVLGCGLAAVPAVGDDAHTAAATTPPGTCPATPAATTANGDVIAGYNVNTQAAGLRYEIDSPGLLPVGNAQQGEIFETDVPYVRDTVGSGPLIDSLASPVYPGDTAAHLGTALSTFGAPPIVPNYAVLADAAYPPSPGHSGQESFNDTAGPTAQGASGTATAGATGSTAVSTMSSTNVGSGTSTFATGSLSTSTSTSVGGACVDGVAESSTGTITIAGLIQIANIHGTASASTDGTTGVPNATLMIGAVTVGGLPAYIDRTGVHLATQQPVGNGVVTTVESTLQRTLAADAITITVIGPTTSVKAGAATANSGAVIVSLTHQVPGVGSPPAGTPPFPLTYTFAYGNAQASVAGTTAPAIPTVAPVVVPPVISQPDVSVPPPSSGPATPSVSPPDTSPVVVSTPSSTQATGGTEQLASNAVAPPPRGSPVPIGWVLIGVALSIVAVGPMLGYARWQLLEGRI